MPPQAIIKNLNLGGISESAYVGTGDTENEIRSVFNIVNLDIHTNPGITQPSRALIKDDSMSDGNLVINEFCEAGVASPRGNGFMFGENGGVFERRTSGEFHKITTLTPNSGSAKVYSSHVFEDVIYYVMDNRVGKMDVRSQGNNWGNRNDNFAETLGGGAKQRPSIVIEDTLYIGHGNRISRIRNGVFTADVGPPISSNYQITCFGRTDNDLLVGTQVATGFEEVAATSTILRWNTTSNNTVSRDHVPEPSINAFLNTDNRVFVSCGYSGSLYVYDGADLVFYRKIHPNAKNTTVLPTSVANFSTRPIFGFSSTEVLADSNNSDIFGVTPNLGIYSLAQTAVNYPIVLSMENTISPGNRSNIQIGAIVPLLAEDKYMVSWKRAIEGGEEVGVDVLGDTYASGYFITNYLSVSRDIAQEFGLCKLAVGRDSNYNAQIFTEINHGSFGEALRMTVPDEEARLIETDGGLGEANIMRLMVKLSPDSQGAIPRLEETIINIPG